MQEKNICTNKRDQGGKKLSVFPVSMLDESKQMTAKVQTDVSQSQVSIHVTLLALQGLSWPKVSGFPLCLLFHIGQLTHSEILGLLKN